MTTIRGHPHGTLYTVHADRTEISGGARLGCDECPLGREIQQVYCVVPLGRTLDRKLIFPASLNTELGVQT